MENVERVGEFREVWFCRVVGVEELFPDRRFDVW